MKRISILSALLLMCAMTFAQQALWGGAPVVSPEIHDNNTVTFRLKAPKAVKVQVTGDFLPTQKIKTPFGEFDGPGVVPVVPLFVIVKFRRQIYGVLVLDQACFLLE